MFPTESLTDPTTKARNKAETSKCPQYMLSMLSPRPHCRSVDRTNMLSLSGLKPQLIQELCQLPYA